MRTNRCLSSLRILFTRFSIGLCSLTLIATQPCASEPVTVGAIASLTGPASEQGRNWLQGAELAAMEMNASQMRVRLLTEDDRTNPTHAVAAFQKLVQVNHARAIIAGTWDFLGEALYPLALRHKIPIFTPTNPSEVLSADATVNPWVFSTSMSLRSVEVATRGFFAHTKPRSMALFVPSLPFGVIQADLLERIARDMQIKVLQRVDFPPDGNFQDSVRTAVLQFRKKQPDLVFAVVDYSILALLLTEFERIQFLPTILTTQHLDAAFAATHAPRLYRTCYGLYPESVLAEDFRQSFKNRFASEPRVFAAEGYETLRFMVEALEQKVQFDNPATPFQRLGILGPLRIPPWYGRSIAKVPTVIMTTRNGIFERWYPEND